VELTEEVLDGLNPSQRAAATAVRGPVAILAGAGTGKTTTITHRIAYQVATRAFRPEQILAVTFTEKAAGELKARLKALGVDRVEARTFHSAALTQLSRLWPRYEQAPLGEILDSKGPLIASLANALPPPHKFLPRRDLAAEIEWAKNRLTSPERYLREVAATGHQPPIPPDLMLRVYEGYERRKRAMQRIDFEDILTLAVGLFDEHPDTAAEIHQRFLAFTVDEYQDVNPLQAALLERWLGGRDELCVVGDDYQMIYGFTGASSSYLLDFSRRFPGSRVMTLEDNYRSTPEILGTANKLAGHLGGHRKTLRATRERGPEPVIHSMRDEGAEVAFVVSETHRLHTAEGVPYEEMAVLYRINARSEPLEEAFAAAHIPYQVRDGAFLRRPGPRAVLHRLQREGAPVVDAVERVTDALGFEPDGGREGDSEEEVTRQADLARLRTLAHEFEETHPDEGLATFLAELTQRFSPERSGRGVNLMTYHRSKGLEFDAVFLPRLLDGELPFRSGRSRAPVEEERRLLYVGITRARRHLSATWPAAAGKARSPFLDEILGGPERPATPSAARAPSAVPVTVPPGGPLFEALKRWRRERAQADGVPAYVVFHDATLTAIAERRPRTALELRTVAGVGPAKLERYGREVLDVVGASE
jgi:DNA helicase-2/ATP-dependent DNA helicase PcrA